MQVNSCLTFITHYCFARFIYLFLTIMFLVMNCDNMPQSLPNVLRIGAWLISCLLSSQMVVSQTFLNRFRFLDLCFIFIPKSDIQRGRETKRKILQPMIYPRGGHNGWSRVKLKPGARCLFQVYHEGAGSQALGHPQLLSQVTSREMDGMWGCRD